LDEGGGKLTNNKSSNWVNIITYRRKTKHMQGEDKASKYFHKQWYTWYDLTHNTPSSAPTKDLGRVSKQLEGEKEEVEEEEGGTDS
jgi:hypothetical protein